MTCGESGAAALAALVVVLCAALAALGCVDVAVLGSARARAGAAADASALAAALVIDSGTTAVVRSAEELASRNGAALVGTPVIDADGPEVAVEVEVVTELPLTGTSAVRASATARLIP